MRFLPGAWKGSPHHTPPSAEALPPGLRQLKWLTIIAPPAALLLLDLLRERLGPDLLNAGPGYLLTGGLAVAGSLAFSETVFGAFARLQRRLAQQNRELLALHEAGLDIAGELGLEAVLQKVVENARRLIGARYGALSLLHDSGAIQAFLTSGMSEEQRAALGPPPHGHGLLSVVLTDGQRLRLSDLTRDPLSVGFPPHHPPMRTLLAVPIFARGRVYGNLYLTEKEDAAEFDHHDEEALVRFATQAALAIENAHLHQQVQALAVMEERERIAREMHDSLAQVLGYVNIKSQAAKELLRQNQPDRAEVQIDQLAQAARSSYNDVRENIMGLRTSLNAARGFLDTLRDYLERWEEQSGISAGLSTAPAADFALRLTPLAELQLLRIIQEALTNVRKHSGAAHAQVELRELDGWVVATVSDDGAGFDPNAVTRAAFPRFGLSTMRERAEAVGGAWAIASAPGEGARITVRIPVDPAAIRGGNHARPHR